MKIYKVWRKDRVHWDEYDSWVVVAETPKKAKLLCFWGTSTPTLNDLAVREVKPTNTARRILGSFNAG